MRKANANGTMFIVEDFYMGILYVLDEFAYDKCLFLFNDDFPERRELNAFLSNFDKNDIAYFKDDHTYIIDRDGYSLAIETDSYWNTVRIKPIWINKAVGLLPIFPLRG